MRAATGISIPKKEVGGAERGRGSIIKKYIRRVNIKDPRTIKERTKRTDKGRGGGRAKKNPTDDQDHDMPVAKQSSRISERPEAEEPRPLRTSVVGQN